MSQKKIDLENYRKCMGIKNPGPVIPKAKRRKTRAPKKTASSPPIDRAVQRPKKAFIDSEELPASYNKTSLTLIARDPYWIHAYWEIAPTTVDAIREKIGTKIEQSTYVLRMYDVTLKNFNGDNANNWFDIDVTPNDHKWYVNLWKDCVTYCGAIGIRTPDQEFLVLARSNFVTTPREHFSGRDDVIWMDIQPRDKGGGWQYPFVHIEQPKKRKKKSSHQGKGSRRKIYLTADDIRAYYHDLFPLLRLLQSKYFPGRKPALQGLTNKNLEKSVLYDLKEGQTYKKIKLGASEGFLLKGGASEQKGGTK